MRMFVLVGFDFNPDDVNDAGVFDSLQTATGELRDALGELLAEHHPIVTVTYDEADVATLTALEGAIETRTITGPVEGDQP